MSGGDRKPPVLPAYAFRRAWWVWCQYCVQFHCHRPTPGHRYAHCRERDSPYRQTGYVLKFAGKVNSLRKVRPGLVAVDEFVSKTTAALTAALVEGRYRMLHAWFRGGKRVKPTGLYPADQFLAGRRTIGKFEIFLSVDLATTDWYIHVRNYLIADSIIREGRGLDTLAEALFGVPAKIAAQYLGELVAAPRITGERGVPPAGIYGSASGGNPNATA